MRTTALSNVLNFVATKVLGAPANMLAEEGEAFMRYINHWVRECWERDFWPEWTTLEERFFAAEWDDAQSYAEGDVVCLVTSTTDDIPGLTAIGTVRAVYPADPRFTRNTPELNWKPIPDGILVQDSRAGGSVWVEFRQRAPVYTSDAFDPAETDYTTGDLVYSGGETYECVVLNPNVGTAPEDNLSDWVLIPFPSILASAVQAFAYAEALEDDGQQDKALIQRDLAEDRLAIEWSKAEGQQGQVRNFKVLTR